MPYEHQRPNLACNFKCAGSFLNINVMNTATTQATEGPVAKAIEKQTSKIPSDVFLWGALGVATASVVLHLFRQRRTAIMIIQGVAPLLIMGLYNKLVKQSGHDYTKPTPDAG
jgi:hypothetical protein